MFVCSIHFIAQYFKLRGYGAIHWERPVFYRLYIAFILSRRNNHVTSVPVTSIHRIWKRFRIFARFVQPNVGMWRGQTSPSHLATTTAITSSAVSEAMCISKPTHGDTRHAFHLIVARSEHVLLYWTRGMVYICGLESRMINSSDCPRSVFTLGSICEWQNWAFASNMAYMTMDPQHLGGVIFGADCRTFAECINRRLFGEYFFFLWSGKGSTHPPVHRTLVRAQSNSQT